MEHGFRKSNITVSKDLENQVHKFDGCSGELQQVFLNLLSNALDAMAPHGEGLLNISFKEGKNGFEINFRDTGTGISDEIIGKVMEPFFTTKGIGKGTGLGLSISYGIVSKHRGNLRFVSCKGQGTTFYITFPFEEETDLSAGNE
jgi:signal transduction histidine kinase